VHRELPSVTREGTDAAGYMLETPSIRRYSPALPVTPPCDDACIGKREEAEAVGSDNPTGADNQQERPGFEEWVVGFVDGEGCFSISVVRNQVCRLGWQVQHEFSVTQGATSFHALERLRAFFGVGTLIQNRRHDNHKDPLWRFSVKRRADLNEVVVPFFEEHSLITAKRADYELFRTVLGHMEKGEHLTVSGLRRIAALTERMNRRQRSRYLESSEAIRQPVSVPTPELKIWSTPHGDMGMT
jgi:hypothetical protein